MNAPDSGLLHGFRRYAALDAEQRQLWWRAWRALLAADLRLRLAPRRTLASALEPPPAMPSPEGDPAPIAAAVASAAAHHLWTMPCLPRALALWRLLSARGHAARVRIGVRKENGRLAAHAWIEVDGAAVGEPEAIDERFRTLAAPADDSR